MIDMKNRGAAAKLSPIDDDMAENTAIRLASTHPTATAPESDSALELRRIAETVLTLDRGSIVKPLPVLS